MRSTREGNVFTLFVHPRGGGAGKGREGVPCSLGSLVPGPFLGGVPQSLVPGPFFGGRGYPSLWFQVFPGGGVSQSHPRSGVPLPLSQDQDGGGGCRQGYPSQVLDQGYLYPRPRPRWGMGRGYPSQVLDRRYPPSPPPFPMGSTRHGQDTPLALTQEDFLVFIKQFATNINSVTQKLCKTSAHTMTQSWLFRNHKVCAVGHKIELERFQFFCFMKLEIHNSRLLIS